MPSSSLLPTDPSVLFTTAGMQQFKPYYLGEKSPWGPNVASCQKCIRTSDIEEVGDERHLTFFEMLGNFSFGQDASEAGSAGSPVSGYWKKEAIGYAYDFVVKELGLKIDYVTVFEGEAGVPEDKESEEIWKSIDKSIVVKKFGRADNFWGPTGEEGPCGPTTEIYVNGIEIWNIVFNEFYQEKDKTLKPLEVKGVDTGMGLERLAMVVQEVPTVFETDLFEPIISKINEDHEIKDEMGKRILADHVRASTFMIADGITPSNTDQGYILRRLLRRAIYYYNSLGLNKANLNDLIEAVIKIYNNVEYKLDENISKVKEVIRQEEVTFKTTLDSGKRKLEKIIQENPGRDISGENAFKLYSTDGYPPELTIELAQENGVNVDMDSFWEELKKHQELSRTSSAGMFKGGLADDKPETIKLHTAHHLLLAALQEMFGRDVKQKGSNINSERLRIDFSFNRKLTDEEKTKLENVVQSKIDQGLDVIKREMPKEEAEKLGAQMEFGVKYGNTVSVYFIQDKKGNIFSKEFCGGPHVQNTKELGKFKIIKEEAVSQGVRRIKATLE